MRIQVRKNASIFRIEKIKNCQPALQLDSPIAFQIEVPLGSYWHLHSISQFCRDLHQRSGLLPPLASNIKSQSSSNNQVSEAEVTPLFTPTWMAFGITSTSQWVVAVARPKRPLRTGQRTGLTRMKAPAIWLPRKTNQQPLWCYMKFIWVTQHHNNDT